jgi:hypothetical protein
MLEISGRSYSTLNMSLNRTVKVIVQMSPTIKTEAKLENKKCMCTAMMPYQYTISNNISRLLGKHNIKTIHSPKRETVQMLRSAKDGLDLYTVGI